MIDVPQTLLALGIEGRESGDELVARCPMHRERTGREDAHPSWSINVRTGLFICFSCGYRGSIVTLISDLSGVDVEAAKTLAVRPDLQTTVARIPGAYVAVAREEFLPEYRLAAFSDPPRWARERRKVSAEACASHGVRWDFDSDTWIIPIRDATANSLLGWQEKSETSRIFRNFPAGVKKSRCLFGYEIFEGGRMIVVESPLDAVRLRSEGVRGAVSTFGSVVSKAQILLMSAADEVVFALDNPNSDSAGKKASIQLLSDTRGVLRSVRFFDYQGIGAKDPGEMSVEQIERGIAHARSRAFGERAVLA